MTSSQNAHSRNTEAGNVLVYILGAIFLLGLLVVLVKGSSTPGSNVDKEKLLIRVAEVQEYGQELERAIAYIMQNGHSEVDIRFAHPDADSAYGVITDTPSRQVFSRNGGGAKYREAPSDIQIISTDWFFTAANSVGTVGSGDQASSSKTELLAMLPNVTEEFCIEINNISGVDNTGGSPPVDDNAMYVDTYPFIGDYSNSTRIRDIPSVAINNTLEGCVAGGANPPGIGTYHYYRVLLAR